MKCPFCGKDDTRVIDSRPADENTSIRRRRVCDSCGKRFTTYEKVETIPLIVIKKGDVREPYDRAKIEAGVFKRKALSVHVASFAGLRQWRDQACLAFASPACSSSSSRALRAMPPA